MQDTPSERGGREGERRGPRPPPTSVNEPPPTCEVLTSSFSHDIIKWQAVLKDFDDRVKEYQADYVYYRPRLKKWV